MIWQTVILENEATARFAHENLVHSAPQLALAGSFANPECALAFLQDATADLLLINTQIPGFPGFSFFDSLRNPPPAIVISGLAMHAFDAFEYPVLDYLLKPVLKPRFGKALQKLARFTDTTNRHCFRPHVFIRDGKDVRRIELEDVLWIEADSDYSKIITKQGSFIASGRIKAFEERLLNSALQRIHRKYIVNLNEVEKLTDNCLVVQGQLFAIGHKYRPRLERILTTV